MQEYSFTSVAVVRRRDGIGLARDYREVIAEKSGEGWAFVQAIPFDDHADPRLDLVFTRKAEQ